MNPFRVLPGEHGARIDRARRRACIPAVLLDRVLSRVAGSVKLYDRAGTQTHDIGADRVYFAPGSAAMHLLDAATGE